MFMFGITRQGRSGHGLFVDCFDRSAPASDRLVDPGLRPGLLTAAPPGPFEAAMFKVRAYGGCLSGLRDRIEWWEEKLGQVVGTRLLQLQPGSEEHHVVLQ